MTLARICDPSAQQSPIAFLRAAILATALLFTLSRPAGAQTPFPSPPSSLPSSPPGWVPTFADEFDGDRLDTAKWTASTGVFVNREQTIHYFLPRNVTVGGGQLHIQSRRETFQNPRDRRTYPFTSGEIRTLGKFSQRYGRFEIRCRFPRTPGIWSAFFLLPDDDSWPPEIDVTEYIGSDPASLYLTHHWKNADGEHEQQDFDQKPAAFRLQDWHTYAVEWEPGVLRRFVDNQPAGTANYGVADVPLYLRLNTAIGGVFARDPASGPWPQSFDVDYVRVWRRADQPLPGLPGAASVAALARSDADARIDTRPEPASRGPFWDSVGLWWLLAIVPLGLLATGRSPNRDAARTRLLGTGVAVSAINYAVWRTGVIGWDYALAVPFFLAELFGIAQVLGFVYTIWPRPDPVLVLEEDPSRRPIFVLIPTVSEGTEILEATISGAISARDRYLAAFPQARITIVVCNDGRVANFSGWREVEALAERMGALCVTRTVGGGAKAGNIEHARLQVGATGDALLALFDADMAARPEFLLRTVPPLADPTVAWVQTGQFYRNRENPVARWADDQQALFYGAICAGKARLNAGFICGTNVVIRASALDEIGGLPQDTVTEDIAASLLLHHRGWRGVYQTEVLATGLGPPTIAAYFAQQRRWSVGVFGLLRRDGRLLLLPGRKGMGLTPAQRIQYLLSGTHYLNGICNFLYLLVPLGYFYAGACAVRPVAGETLLEYLLPYWLLSLLLFRHASGGKTHWRGVALGFSSFPVTVASLVSVLAGRRARFTVTDKTRRAGAGPGTALVPHAIALALCLGGLGLSLSAAGNPVVVVFSGLWLAQMACLLAAFLGVALRRR